MSANSTESTSASAFTAASSAESQPLVVENLTQWRDDYQNYLAVKKELSAFDGVELRWRRTAFYAFVFAVLIVGLPIWYVTTTPYRARLPYFGEAYRQKIREFLVDEEIFNETDVLGDIWLQAAISPRYNVHVVFVHDDATTTAVASDFDAIPSQTQQFNERRREECARRAGASILLGVRSFTRLLAESVQTSLSAEHLFDFSLAEFLRRHAGDGAPLVLESVRASALTAKIDRLSTPPISGADPLVKIVVFVRSALDENGAKNGRIIRFVDSERETADGLAVASWGGFVALNLLDDDDDHDEMNGTAAALNAVFAILRLELGVVAARQRVADSPLVARLIRHCANESGKGVCRMPHIDALHHRVAAAVEHLTHCVHAIDSLHDLADKLFDLVISDEVARLANRAHESFFLAYRPLILERSADFDALASVEARLLAEAAITHSSLLEFLNFPSDQKIGIYLPLYFPVFVPILMPVATLALFIARRVIAAKRRKIAEKKAD